MGFFHGFLFVLFGFVLVGFVLFRFVLVGFGLFGFVFVGFVSFRFANYSKSPGTMLESLRRAPTWVSLKTGPRPTARDGPAARRPEGPPARGPRPTAHDGPVARGPRPATARWPGGPVAQS